MTELERRLTSRGQAHLLAHLEGLQGDARDGLTADLADLDLDTIRLGLEADGGPVSFDEAEPYPWIQLAEREARDGRAVELGLEALRAGRVAAVLMAGGSGTRLGWQGPKGTFPVYEEAETSLYEIHARKVRRVAELAGARIPLAIMLSPQTAAPTARFFEERGHFGLPREDLILFEQRTLPAVDDEGRVLMADPARMTAFPDGHGGIYRALDAAGVLDAFEARGVEHVFLFQVDNPLVPILDPAFLGYHLEAGSEFSFMAARKADPKEKVGVFAVQPSGEACVVEYIDLPERLVREWELFSAGNIAIYALSVPFMTRVAREGRLVPHRSSKKVPYYTPEAGVVTPDAPNAFKLEKLLFDAITLAARHVVVEVRRGEAFAPIKNATGVDSAESARALLRDRALELLGRAGYPIQDIPSDRAIHITPELLVDEAALGALVASGGLGAPDAPGPLTLAG
jgi:UDP-N-acetylglucosamine/UDP-N-acetylgalactosamine diphosphorylase